MVCALKMLPVWWDKWRQKQIVQYNAAGAIVVLGEGREDQAQCFLAEGGMVRNITSYLLDSLY